MLQIELMSSHLCTVSLFPLQGDINTKEQKRREQVKMERDLRAQIEDNEKRRSGEKHRGGKKTQTLNTDELALRCSLCKSHTRVILFCANNHTLPRTALTARWHWWMSVLDSFYASVNVLKVMCSMSDGQCTSGKTGRRTCPHINHLCHLCHSNAGEQRTGASGFWKASDTCTRGGV